MGKPKNVQELHKKGVRRKRSVGAYGSKRGVPDKQVARTRGRYDQKRVRESIEQARSEQEALERRIAAEAENPTMGLTPGAIYAEREAAAAKVAEAEDAARLAAEEAQARVRAEERRRNPGPLFQPNDGEGRGRWTIGQARKMLRQGYHVQHVIDLTGVGYRWLNDLAVDLDGYGVPHES